MPNPKLLKIGERIIFNSLPKEWADPGYTLIDESREFMELLVKRKRHCTIKRIDEFGTPWIEISIRVKGKPQMHSWGIFERSGWKRLG